MAFRNLLKPYNLYRFSCIRELCSATHDYTKVLVPLKHRKLLKIYGEDSSEFLQGLITNDMRHFEDGAKSVYALFLNNKGRIMYDTLIHKWEGNDSFIVECDRTNFSSLLKHLSVFKLKRKVRLEDMNREYHLWALLSAANLVPDAELDPKSPINVFKDPRLQELGCRLLTVLPLKGSQIVEMLGHNVELDSEDLYRYWRYKLGVGEGPEELPPGACFPLEANCDYLHGVSFYKGCYIGQELTARVYHTGVIRKRLMPIRFFDEITDFIEKDFPIVSANNPKNKIGKLKNYIHDRGLGLVNVKSALEMQTLKIGDNSAEIIKPSWWPIESPKEKAKMEDVSKVKT